MTQELSNKLKIGSLICTIMVVYRHSLNLEAFFGESVSKSYCTFIESGISKLTEIAVPYFFLLSGYFFFSHSYLKFDFYKLMLKKKVHSLFIPFIFWNLAGILPLMLAHQFVFEPTFWLYFRDLLHSDWNGVLWYVRDIMTLMLFVPLYGWIFVLNSKWLYLILTGGLFIHWLPVDSSWVSSEGLLFFSLGGIIKNTIQVPDFKIPVWLVFSLTCVWLFSCFFYPYYWPVHRYNTMIGIFLFWQLLDYIPSGWNKILLQIAPYSFFIYVTHLYIVKAIKVTLAHYYYGSDMVALLAYFIIPVITIFISLFIGKLWNKHMSQSFFFVTGGRG